MLKDQRRKDKLAKKQAEETKVKEAEERRR